MPSCNLIKSLLAGIILQAAQAVAPAISIIWDYTYDTGGFFNQDRRDVLGRVGAVFDNYEMTRMELTPGGGNSWSWNFKSPGTGGNVSLSDPTASADTVRIFVGGRDLGASSLGLGGGVGWGASGSQQWLDDINSYNTPTKYSPFGGTITISTNSTLTWYHGESDSVPGGEYDLYSVALHELGHVLGIQSSGVDAWDAQISSDEFLGPNAKAIYGANIPLEADHAHIESGTTYGGQSFVMVPAVPSGTRRFWTAPEFGILQDLGYTLVPEPNLIVGVLVFGMGYFALRRRVRPQIA